MANIYDRIADPTQGKLGNIGTKMLQIKQMEMQKEESNLRKMLTEANLSAQEMTLFKDEATATYGVTNAILNEIKSKPDLATDPDLYNQYISTISEGLPEGVGQKIQGLQPSQVAEINRKSGQIMKVFSEKDVSAEYGDFEQIPGRPEFVGQKNKDTGKYDNVKRMKEAPLVDMSQEETYIKERQKVMAQGAVEIEKSADSAYKNIQSLERFINKSGKAQEGGMQPLMTGVQNLFASVGVDFEGLTNVREMEQAVADIKANYMSELGARGLTDKDMEILGQRLPRVSTDKESRVAVARILQKTYAASIDEYMNMREQESKNYPELKVFDPRWKEKYGTMNRPWESEEDEEQPTPLESEQKDFGRMSDEEFQDYLSSQFNNIGKMRVDERP